MKRDKLRKELLLKETMKTWCLILALGGGKGQGEIVPQEFTIVSLTHMDYSQHLHYPHGGGVAFSLKISLE